jgi:hypothetical protein
LIASGWLYVIAAAAGAAVALTGASWKYGEDIATLKSNQAAEQTKAVKVVNDKLVAEQERTTKLQAELAAQDTKYTGMLKDVVKAADERIADLESGRSGMSVTVRNPVRSNQLPAVTGAGRVDDGTYTAELLPATAARIAGIGKDADSCAVKLTALQGWVKTTLQSR